MAGDVTLGALKRFKQLMAGQSTSAVAITGGTLDGVTIGGTTPAAMTVTGLTATGNVNRSVATGLTATGSSRAGALALTKDVNLFSTVAASTGAVLPAGVVGMQIAIFNAGASPLTVYGNGSDTIDGTAGSTGVALANAKRCLYFCTAANTWVSAQLGVVSA